MEMITTISNNENVMNNEISGFGENICLTGEEFNILYPSEKVKLTKADNCHNGYMYKEGLNVLDGEFDTKRDCGPGGLYFCFKENYLQWCEYGMILNVNMWDVIIPNDAKIIVVGTKVKTDKMILCNRRTVYSKKNFGIIVDSKKGKPSVIPKDSLNVGTQTSSHNAGGDHGGGGGSKEDTDSHGCGCITMKIAEDIIDLNPRYIDILPKHVVTPKLYVRALKKIPQLIVTVDIDMLIKIMEIIMVESDIYGHTFSVFGACIKKNIGNTTISKLLTYECQSIMTDDTIKSNPKFAYIALMANFYTTDSIDPIFDFDNKSISVGSMVDFTIFGDKLLHIVTTLAIRYSRNLFSTLDFDIFGENKHQVMETFADKYDSVLRMISNDDIKNDVYIDLLKKKCDEKSPYISRLVRDRKASEKLFMYYFDQLDPADLVNSALIRFVKEDNITQKMCDNAVKNIGWNIFFIPTKFVDTKICRLAYSSSVVPLWNPTTVDEVLLYHGKLQDPMYINNVLFGSLRGLAECENELEYMLAIMHHIFSVAPVLSTIPRHRITHRMAHFAIKYQNDTNDMFVPDKLYTWELCESMVAQHPMNLFHLPEKFIDQGILDLAKKTTSQNMGYDSYMLFGGLDHIRKIIRDSRQEVLSDESINNDICKSLGYKFVRTHEINHPHRFDESYDNNFSCAENAIKQITCC